MGLILLVSIAGCMTLPEPPQVEKQDPRISQSHLEMSFEDLSQVGHYLEQNKVGAAPQIYRSLVDEKYSEVQEDYLKRSLKGKVAFWKPECAATCSCDIYVGFSEYLQSFNFLLSATELKAVDKLKLLRETEKTQIGACLQQAPWVGESRVLKEVLKRAN
jgi:hypothetical protein